MTVEEFEEVFTPVMDNIGDKLDIVVADISYLIKLQAGLIVFIGVVAGLILISYLLERF